ncbi:G-type lectin S-receptor-like serine/threonine-protein kinase [Citrus sinensis]|nr:G-type lectin S-receptor-like serine/threonine-protein kinase [Citrus sinensis]
MENLLCFYIFSFWIFFLIVKLSLAADTITPARSIRDGEKLVSSSQTFELGFFSPGNSRYSKYLGIWYKKSPETIVWVANRNSPILDPSAVLTVSSNGNLVLLNVTKGIIWSSNISRKVENPVAQLQDTGNLVLVDVIRKNTSESYLWQSFDYPSDTLLPGMKVGWNLKTGVEWYLTSWRSADDPSPGNFTSRLDIHVLPEICIYNGSVKYFCTGPWSGVAFVAAPSYTNFLYNQELAHNQDEIYFSYESYNSPSIMMLKLNPSGTVQRLIWNERNAAWDVVYSAPNVCGVYGKCGANSICILDKGPNCECLKGFKLKSQDNQTWPGKCERNHSSYCKSGDQFIKLDGIKAPDLLQVSVNDNMNLKQCEAECLKNCTCRAYAYSNLTEGSGCLMWFGDLIDISKTLGNFTGQSVYIRVPALGPGKKKLLWITIIAVLMAVLLPAFYIFYRWRRKLRERRKVEISQDILLLDTNMSIATRETGNSKESWLPFFSLASITAATDNFSGENKLGEGGFGPVYKGKLNNGEEVAVKRLSSQSGQGLEEFKNEMMLIAKLQHRNLVRLFGCCIEHGEKILIYEYMPNKSLDCFLFDPTNTGLLGWEMRVRILEGVAQGNMNPKISDFGIARLFGGDELQSNTKRIVGTYGYMSPEYALRGLFSIKSDVFSFGVLVLETLSSKKNAHFYNTDSLTLLGHAWNLWNDGRAWELMDSILQNDASYPMLNRYINVALLCVQENAADRPTMLEVISMLTNENVILPSPLQPAFSHVRIAENSSLPANCEVEACTVNCLTLSAMDAR